ncbi:MAG: hypothetical protein ACFFD4_32480, partial [Candidatus Odinarchaeota archaeon]
VRYDSFHYYCQTDRYDVLQGCTDDGKRVKFIIANNWHSLSVYYGQKDIWDRLSDLGFIVTLLSTIGIVTMVFADPRLSEILLDSSAALLILLTVSILYAVSNARSFYPLVDKNGYEVLVNQDSKKTRTGPVDFNNSLFHLTNERMLLFWNLKSAEARLQIRQKLQAPFSEELSWMTFKDYMGES